MRESIERQIMEMKEHPFQPHAIARGRTRAYMIAVVLRYLENVLAWGDQLFRQSTSEAINQATQLYVRAARLLGNRPRSTTSPVQSEALSYRLLRGRWDEFANAWHSLEGLAAPFIRHQHPAVSQLPGLDINGLELAETATPVRTLGTLYFCVPTNEQLGAYWDIVEDRLFKIRHCMNIDGVAVQWPLFEPPIDPRLLVQAAAAGLDIAGVLDGLYTPLSRYRYSLLAQKATELAAEVRSMGAALLMALEKQDAEELALLRSKQERELLEKVKVVRLEQIREAQANLVALRQSRETAVTRYRHYQKLLGVTTIITPAEQATMSLYESPLRPAPGGSLADDEQGLGMLSTEQQQLAWLSWAHIYSLISGGASALAGVLHALNDFSAGNMVAQTKTGGSHFGHAANAGAALAGMLATNANHLSVTRIRGKASGCHLEHLRLGCG